MSVGRSGRARWPNRVSAALLGVSVALAGVVEFVEAQDGGRSDIMDQVEHHYADSDGVSIHYALLGDGPLVVMVHGFPDFWYTWRDQMSALADVGFRVAAMDTRQ